MRYIVGMKTNLTPSQAAIVRKLANEAAQAIRDKANHNDAYLDGVAEGLALAAKLVAKSFSK